jgi:hypothetical protein
LAPQPDDRLDYQGILEDALRDVVRRVLARVAEHGLPGDHYFYLSFRTGHPGVLVPSPLRERYPEEMTVVLQHQFWNLEVGPEAFSVELNFSTARHVLRIPFAALTAFTDPAAEFALRFEGLPGPAADAPALAVASETGGSGQGASPAATGRPAAAKVAAGARGKAPRRAVPAAVREQAPAEPADAKKEPPAGGKGVKSGEVIRFDPSRRR